MRNGCLEIVGDGVGYYKVKHWSPAESRKRVLSALVEKHRPSRTALLLRKGGRECLEHSKALVASRVSDLSLANGKRAEAAHTGCCTHDGKEEGQQQSCQKGVVRAMLSQTAVLPCGERTNEPNYDDVMIL